MATGDIYRFTWEGELLGSQYINTQHVKFLSEAATPTGLISLMKTNWWNLLDDGFIDGWKLTVVHARKLSVPALLYDEVLTNVGSVVAAEGLPPQSAMCITLRTGIVGRARRGRMFLGGWAEDAQADGHFGTTLRNALQGYLDDLIANIGSAGSSVDYQWGVWSRKYGGDDPGPYDLTAGFRAIESGICRSIVYTQRRRVEGVGR